MKELPKFEVYIYFLIWTGGICISLYHLFLVGKVFDHRHHDQYHYEDFKEGWTLLGGRYQDQADYEWNTWTTLFIKLTPFLLLNLVGAEWIRYKKLIKYLPFWYSGITVFVLIFHFNIGVTIWFIIQSLIYVVLMYFKSYICIWFLSFIIIHFLKPDIWFTTNEEDQYLVMISSSWMVLRCISFSCDNLKEKSLNMKVSDIYVLLGYSFYLPTMFCGPFISFCYFDNCLKKKYSKWSSTRAIKLLKKFFRCLFWYYFTVFALHFLYVNAILLRPDFVKHLLDWELAGLGIAMGHFFHLKYIVFYGLPCAWASAEGLTTPNLPCCVSRVHLYSYMWRHFDRGLYEFLVKYIYIPVMMLVKGKSIYRKILASIGCFSFMFTWHREQPYVFFWVFFNFVAVTLELIGKQILNFDKVKQILDANIRPQNQLRLLCFITAPLHCFSMISNYFFIGNGMDVGLIYLKRILNCQYCILIFNSKTQYLTLIVLYLGILIFSGSLLSKVTILFFLYGAGHSAVAAQNCKIKNESID